VITNASFVLSTWLLFHLSCLMFRDEEGALRVVRAYSLTPANVFMSSVYTESPFAAFTFGGLLLLAKRRPAAAAVTFAAATALRSNGLLNCLFVLHFALVQGMGSNQPIFWLCCAGTICGIVVAPYVLVQAYAFSRECYGEQAASWCNAVLPNVYGHVQATYWNVGLLRYFQLWQLPNFLLAAPALGIVCWGTRSFVHAIVVDWHRRRSDGKQGLGSALMEWHLLPHVVHWTALSAFLFLCANVQVTTRVLAAACPIHHWCTAALLNSTSGNTRWCLRVYIVLWNVIGVVMHPNFLPWT